MAALFFDWLNNEVNEVNEVRGTIYLNDGPFVPKERSYAILSNYLYLTIRCA